MPSVARTYVSDLILRAFNEVCCAWRSQSILLGQRAVESVSFSVFDLMLFGFGVSFSIFFCLFLFGVAVGVLLASTRGASKRCLNF